jgi:hypothetical protein
MATTTKKGEAAVVASYTEMGKVLPRLEEAVSRAPVAGRPPAPLERARMLASLNNAMGELRKMQERPGVLSTPRDQFASLLQSTFAEHAADKGKVQTVKGVGTLEAKFDTTDPGWVSVAWEKLKSALKGRIKWVVPPKPLALPPDFRMAVMGDWATGLYGAPVISRSIDKDAGNVDVVMHLGDTYYSGTDREFAKRFVPQWPQRAGAIGRALNGNHEMYSGGKAYLKTVAAKFGQKSTAFVLANDHWLLVGMDTALDDHSLNPEQVRWLDALVTGASGRKVALFSHHQPFSRLDSQGPKLVEKLGSLLNAGKIHAWFWGHEHRCVLYDKHPAWKMWGRCVGHGGIPEFRDASLGKCPPKPTWRAFQGSGNIPACQVLDGPNEFVKLHQKLYSPQGYAMLTFAGPKLTEEIRDANGVVLRTTDLV